MGLGSTFGPGGNDGSGSSRDEGGADLLFINEEEE